MWSSRSGPNSRLRETFREELNSRHAEDFGQALNRARAYVLRAPFDALIPLQIRAEQGGDLLLRQAVLLAQYPNASGNEFEKRHAAESRTPISLNSVRTDTFSLDAEGVLSDVLSIAA